MSSRRKDRTGSATEGATGGATGSADRVAAGEPVTPRARRALLRLHKSAFGTAVGLVAGGGLMVLTALHLFLEPGTGVDLSLLAEFFYGYEVSWGGMLVGGLWGFGVGFVGGWFAAFCRNLVVACYLRYGRARAELEATRDFLDHI